MPDRVDPATCNLALDQCEWLAWLCQNHYDYMFDMRTMRNVVVDSLGNVVASYYCHRPLYGVPMWYIWYL